MALQEKISREDLALYEVLRHPVFSAEFLGNIDKLEWEEPFGLHYYQLEYVCDFSNYVSIRAARAVGKTLALVYLIIWLLLNDIFPGDYIVYSVPNKVHLEPVFTGLIRQLRSSSVLKHFIEPNKGINSSTNTIKLKNQATLICRIAGQSGTGANVIGLHSPFIIVDETGYYPWGTWLELQPVLNTWTPGYRMIGAGVPTGLRENNVNYHIDQDNSNYTKHRISAYDNPRFSKEDESRAVEQYGGRDSEDFVHLVLGEHGSPIFAVFDRRLLNIKSYRVYKLTLDGIKIKNNIAEYIEKIAIFPGIPIDNRGVLIGIDLGYTDPTAIVIMYLDKDGVFKFHGRIQLNKVPYPIQKNIIDHLDSKFEPVLIGIDEGHAGIAVTQGLLAEEAFIHKDYSKRLIPINFSSKIPLGFDADGDEIMAKVRPFSVSVLQDYSNNHRIIYSTMDLEMVAELERMTYSKNPSGDIIYKTLTPKGGKKGEDHFTAALLSGIIAWYMENEQIVPRRKSRKLFNARWFA